MGRRASSLLADIAKVVRRDFAALAKSCQTHGTRLTIDVVQTHLATVEIHASASTIRTAVKPLEKDGIKLRQGSGFVRDERRRGYAPPPSGAAVKTLAFIVAEAIDTFAAAVIAGALAQAREAGYRVLVFDSAQNPEHELAAFHEACQYACAVVMIPIGRGLSDPQGLTSWMRWHQRPVVFVERHVPQLEELVDLVVTDNIAGGRQAGEHLIRRLRIGKGRTRPVYCVTKDDSSGQLERWSGFEQAFAGTVRVTPQRVTVAPQGDDVDAFTQPLPHLLGNLLRHIATARAAERRKGEAPGTRAPYAGLFCAADNLAVSTQHYLRRHHIQSPDDVLMIGYDDLFFAKAISLSTIRQNFDAMGRRAVDRALALVADVRRGRASGEPPPRRLFMRSKDEAQTIRLKPTLVKRRSTRLAPAARSS